MKGKKLSVLGVILIISFLIYIVYLVSSNILLNYGMEFRESVIEFIAWDKFVFVIMLNILIIRIIMKRKKIGKEKKLFFTLKSFFISAAITFIFVLAPYILISRGETLAYKEGNLLLAVSSSSLHDS
ncbi:hypothetical protein [Clostridium perfringens]|nr:hypothetical protein [Clostridium perfringens]